MAYRIGRGTKRQGKFEFFLLIVYSLKEKESYIHTYYTKVWIIIAVKYFKVSKT